MVYKIEFHAMGSEVMAALDSSEADARILERVPGWFDGWENSLSRFCGVQTARNAASWKTCAGLKIFLGSAFAKSTGGGRIGGDRNPLKYLTRWKRLDMTAVLT